MKGIKELGVHWFSDDGVGVATPKIHERSHGKGERK